MATIVVGVTGDVAAFKTPIMIHECQHAGHDIYVAAARASLDFISRSTWEGITSRPTAVDITGEGCAGHVELTRVADLIVAVPTVANSLTRLAAGFTDDMVSLTVLTSGAPIVTTPAVRSNMWLAPAMQVNVQALRDHGLYVIGPTSGVLNSGDRSVGRLPEPEEIARVTLGVLAAHDQASSVLAGRTVVVAAGNIREPVDPVHFLGNKSFSRQGLAIMSTEARAGASVHVITANIESALLATLSTAAQVTQVGSALQMREATITQVADADVLMMTTAVADFQPEAASESKVKRDLSNEEAPTIRLARSPDILTEIRHGDQRLPLVVGLAAETGTDKEILAYGTDKAARKGADFTYLNRVGKNVGFGDVPNDIQLLDTRGNVAGRYIGSKNEVAAGLIDHMTSFLDNLRR